MPEVGCCMTVCGWCFSAPRASVGLERKYRRMERKQRFREKSEAATHSYVEQLAWHTSPGVRMSAALVAPGDGIATEFDFTKEVIGRGGMGGDVMLGRRKKTFSGLPGEGLVAIKRLRKTGLSKSKQKRLFEEARTFLHMDHPHVARLIRVSNSSDHIEMVMEYCSGGSLSGRMAQVGKFSDSDAAHTIYQILSAVNYCHKHTAGKVVHRDLKPANFVYANEEPNAPLKLIDFGLSTIMLDGVDRVKGFAGTLHYMAPEVFFSEDYDESCDLWSIGVIAFTLVYGFFPFDGTTESSVVKNLEQAEIDWTVPQGRSPGTASKEADNFILALLVREPSQRPTAEEAMQHPWLNKDTLAPAMVHRSVLERVRRFASENSVRRAVATFMVYHLDCDEEGLVKLANEQFQVLDVDNDGTISEEELCDAMRQGLFLKEEEARWVFDQIDVDGNKKITRCEFVSAVMGEDMLCRSKDDTFAAFQKFDINKDGKIGIRELEAVLGPEFCGRPTRNIISEFDVNGDKSIDFEEFREALRGENSARVQSLSFDGTLVDSPMCRFSSLRSSKVSVDLTPPGTPSRPYSQSMGSKPAWLELGRAKLEEDEVEEQNPARGLKRRPSVKATVPLVSPGRPEVGPTFHFEGMLPS
eukprot:TRINITY_DN37722_c0_g1_i1.p1 TRINITY_DN37722_c0_g1~~TRINITY_DN37722_c0_g1_i1.p1  ORF type:complete len:662 (-),score=116.03 TRINITY_DN37722_c0_g1_i1:39-1958(-)